MPVTDAQEIDYCCATLHAFQREVRDWQHAHTEGEMSPHHTTRTMLANIEKRLNQLVAIAVSAMLSAIAGLLYLVITHALAAR